MTSQTLEKPLTRSYVLVSIESKVFFITIREGYKLLLHSFPLYQTPFPSGDSWGSKHLGHSRKPELCLLPTCKCTKRPYSDVRFSQLTNCSLGRTKEPPQLQMSMFVVFQQLLHMPNIAVSNLLLDNFLKFDTTQVSTYWALLRNKGGGEHILFKTNLLLLLKKLQPKQNSKNIIFP